MKKLGAFGGNLAAVSRFFDNPWSRPAPGLSDHVKAGVLNWAGFALRALGRLREAREPTQAGIDSSIAERDWLGAAVDANNLSELSLTIGEIGEALEHARRSVEFADSSRYKLEMFSDRTTLADALHQSGDVSTAKSLFEEAEKMQRDMLPEHPLLYSLWGYRFCDLLLSQGEYQQVRKRVRQTLVWVEQAGGDLLSLALDTLSLGRAALLQAQVEGLAALPEAERYLNEAVQGLRESGNQDDLPRGLLARAELHRFSKDWADAWRDLDEAREIAERGEMRLFLADYHLEAARLSLAEGKKDQAREHFTTAKQMVEEMGYGRRKPEVDDLEKQLTA